jgi:tRNA threonylcarbamoyladenosine biosynthesis protein TsaE
MSSLLNCEHVCADETELANLALQFGQILKHGDVCMLYGEVGAGKTFFTTKLYESLGGNPDITGSPSFTLVNHYPLDDIDFYHVDLYRLNGVIEEDSIDQEDWMEPNGYSFIEWAERLGEWKPERGYLLTFRYYDSGRAVKLEAI